MAKDQPDTQPDVAYLLYQGHPDEPQRRGGIPGLTPEPERNQQGFVTSHGVAPGWIIEINDDLLTSLGKPTGKGKALEFAEFVAGVHSANHAHEPWKALDAPPKKADLKGVAKADDAKGDK